MADRDPAGDEGIVSLRFRTGGDGSDSDLSELNAAQVAEVLQGLVELVSLAARTGALGDDLPPPEVKVRPPRQGSFLIEAVLEWAANNPEASIGLATSAAGNVVLVIKLLVKNLRIAVTDFEYLEDGGTVKIQWQDGTVDVVERAVWDVLSKNRRKTKRQLRKILAPLAQDAQQLDIAEGPPSVSAKQENAPSLTASREDYRAALPVDEIEEMPAEVFDVEGRLRRIDFQPDQPWKVQTTRGSRSAVMEDADFLARVNQGLPLRETDIFRFRIRESVTVKNGRRTTSWVIIEVLSHRAGSDDDAARDAQSV